MRDRIIPSPYPEEETVDEPKRAQENQEEPSESDPFDDDIDGEAVPLRGDSGGVASSSPPVR